MMNTRRGFLKTSSMGMIATVFHSSGGASNKHLLEIEDDARQTIVCVGAHPGDPEFGCGGTMAKYSDAGHNVIFLYLTRGEAYNSNITHQQAANTRTKEAQEACEALKVKPMFFGEIDGDTELNNRRNAEMVKMLSSVKPDIVYTQWPIDSHMDHQCCGLLTLTAWVKMNKSFDLYFYEVNSGSETMLFTPTVYSDISGAMDKKKAAMYAHQSQDPDGTYKIFFKKMEEFRGLEANVKAAEAFVVLKRLQPAK